MPVHSALLEPYNNKILHDKLSSLYEMEKNNKICTRYDDDYVDLYKNDQSERHII